jgi:hypothetical protein
MKQKYAITRNADTGRMTIQEFAELDKDVFSLVCEESYDGERIRAAAAEGKEPLIEVLRTPNLYPVSEYAEKIAESVRSLLDQDTPEPVEIEFDDIEALSREPKAAEEETSEEDEGVALDDLLEDDEDSGELDEDAGESEGSEESDDMDEGSSLSDDDSLDVFDDDENA